MNQLFPETTGFLADGGEMGTQIRAFDWSQTPLGPLEAWPQSLKTSVNLILSSQQPMWIGWGPQATFLYNDAYISVLSQAKHPWALGRPSAEVWAEIWDICGPLADQVFRFGKAPFVEDVRLFMNRGAYLEETFYSFSYSPIRDETGQVAGLFCPNTEVTARNLNTRRLQTLSALALNALVEKTTQAACRSVGQTIDQNPDDLPFALLYLTDADGMRLRLANAVRLPLGDARLSPSVVLLDGAEPGPLGLPVTAVMQQGKMDTGRWPADSRLAPGPAGQPVTQAVVLPLTGAGQDKPLGVLVAGVNPTRPLDADYRTFYELVANQVTTAVQNARAAEEERRRLDMLAELNQAKTLFFSNVSHEFRTPLTLMLGPLGDLLQDSHDPLTAGQYGQVEAAHRNAQRLLRLVNTLLDFSRIEAGRMQAVFEPTDLVAFTTDLTSSFRSVIEKANMQLVVQADPLTGPVAVDRTMWEKIVLNLLSNAFKFTLEGTITVGLAQEADEAVLTVRDTGIGIPAADLPKVFDRFHRVAAPADRPTGRSFEGTGIGLALVKELVELHGGSIHVSSEPARGSVFTVRLPMQPLRISPVPITTTLPADAVRAAQPFLIDADPTLSSTIIHSSPAIAPDKAGTAENGVHRRRILLADDNADMRAYIGRLLSPHYVVDAVADGQEALDSIRRQSPDLILSDIMMPRLDGIGLLKMLKADAKTARLPVILLSARAGEEATIDGYDAGTDDYLVKPFSANELLARVRAQLKLADVRRESDHKLRRLLMQAPVAMAIFRGPDFIIELVNEKHLQFWNRTLDEVLGRPVFEVLPSAAGQGYETIMKRVLQTGEPWSATEQYVELNRNGEREGIWVDVVYQPLLEDDQVAGIIEVVYDVTTQVKARQQIEANEADLRNLFEQAPVGIAILRGPDHTFELANAFYLDFVGRHHRDEIVGRPLFEALPEVEGQGFDQLLTTVVQTGVPFMANEQPVRLVRNGQLQTAYINFIYQPLPAPDPGVFAVLTDVTQQVTARQKIEESRQQFEQLADLVPQIIWTARPDGISDYYNQQWYDYTGLDKGFGDAGWSYILHPDDLQPCLDTWYRSVQTGEPFQMEYRFADRRHPGQYRWFIGRTVPVTNSAGTIVKWFGSATDIHEQKTQAEYLEQVVAERTESLRKANFSLERTNTDLQHSNFDLMQFASVASHDLKEPLRKIQAFSILLTQTLAGKLDEEEQSHFNRIIRSAARMQALVDDVLRLSKLSKTDARHERVDLNAVIARIQDDLEITIREKGAMLRVGSLPTVEAVPGQMHQLFQNLISNALKFANDRPPVVTISVDRLTPELRNRFNLPDRTAGTSYVVVSVRDNGIGIAAAHQETIFGMFQRLHGRGQYEGTGIGLTICRRIVENHHGYIWAESQPGKGASFRIIVPMQQQAAATAQP